MKIYGFSNSKQIFTVWEVSYSYEDIDRNRRYKVYNYKYCGRTSETPEELNSNVNDRLRSFKKKEIEFTNVNTFRYGKYAGKNIAEVNDLNYTKWYFGTIEDKDHKKFVKELLYDNWYEFKTNRNGDEYAVSPEYIEKINKINEKREIALNKAKANKTVLLEINSNPNCEGKIYIDDVAYKFANVVARNYMGYIYYMPTKNGYAKRIKNKVIKAKLMEIDGEIYIANFSVV